MSTEQFEKWAASQDISHGLNTTGVPRAYAAFGWTARQPEIDAKDKAIDDLALQKTILLSSVGSMGDENAALKADLQIKANTLVEREIVINKFSEAHSTLQAKNIWLEAENEKLRRDAKRYQWLRTNIDEARSDLYDVYHSELLDRYIDAAMKETK